MGTERKLFYCYFFFLFFFFFFFLFRWHSLQINRMIVDYMLRGGHYDVAMKLAQSENIEMLVDGNIFKYARKIFDGLKNKSCTEALQWCKENASKLKKFESTLEFDLKIQEFIELARVRDLQGAIT